MADSITQPDGYGLNKAARLKRDRADTLKENQPPPLQPDFPFRVQPFDPLFFGADDSHLQTPPAAV